MSAFGDRTLTQDILDSLDWIVGSDKKEQLQYVHEKILLIINGEDKYLGDDIKSIVNEHDASVKDLHESLGRIYSYFVEWWELPEQ